LLKVFSVRTGSSLPGVGISEGLHSLKSRASTLAPESTLSKSVFDEVFL
jgi:hypothetical protein